jgi:hypothetical protein
MGMKDKNMKAELAGGVQHFNDISLSFKAHFNNFAINGWICRVGWMVGSRAGCKVASSYFLLSLLGY